MNTQNDLLREISILETVMGSMPLTATRKAIYERKVSFLRSALKATVATIRRFKK